ncbi:MAG: hypothetical protein V4454_14495 [Pseudomonadota bacterium]
MTSIFDHMLAPEPDGVMPSIWMQACTEAWVKLALNRTRLEGVNQALMSWQTMGHINPFMRAGRTLDSSFLRQ